MPADDQVNGNLSNQPSESKRRSLALELIENTSTLTLATTDETGPWSAPVYYVFMEGRFFFFSSPNSRHITQAISTGQAAASIFAQESDWQSIRGVQMQGMLEQVRALPLSVQIFRRYLNRFSFVRDFFAGERAIEPKMFLERFKVRLYRFTPREVLYLDNRSGLGSRQPISWQE